MPQSHANRRAYLAAAAVILTLLGLIPAKYGAWMNSIGDKAFLLAGPVTAPIYRAVRWITPAPTAESEEITALRDEADRWKTLYLQAVRETDEAQRKLDALAKGAVLVPMPEAQLVRPVIGASAEPGGTIQVRAGARDGVEVNSVATTVGVQLVGRVIATASRICTVRLINDHATGRISGCVMISDSVRGSKCLLSPVTNGLLQGLVSLGAGDKPPGIGQLVRLVDDKWPQTSQMLVVGRIKWLETDSTGHCIITVEPTTDLQRLSEVVLRISRQDTEERGAPAGTSRDGTQ